MISTPPAVSRQAATAIADRPATRPSRLPASPPVPHSNPDVTRQSRPAGGREENARIGESLLRREEKRSRKRGAPKSTSRPARQCTPGYEKTRQFSGPYAQLALCSGGTVLG